MNKHSIKIEEVIKEVIYSLYHDGVFSENILIKGGQAIRIKEKIEHRFSVDIDASVNGEIQDPDVFFIRFKKSLDKRFLKYNLVTIDFKREKKPKNPHPDAPAFWTGWLVTFKLLDKSNEGLTQEKMSRMAIIPDGIPSPKIVVELSEYEYCGDNEIMNLKIDGEIEEAVVYCYSTEMLVIEKLRAICQQHPEYPHRRKPANRARDYYDIVNLIEKKIRDKKYGEFKEKCSNLVQPIFEAKEVQEDLINKIFEKDFLEEMEKGWPLVLKTTPSEDRKEFEVYVDILKDFTEAIRK
jgi:hypothetical protein